MARQPNFHNGIVELLMLAAIAEGPSWGYAIAQRVAARSGSRFAIKEGSLYIALQQLERKGFLKSSWSEFEGRRRKNYRLTPAGRRSLATRRRDWGEFVEGVRGVLGPA